MAELSVYELLENLPRAFPEPVNRGAFRQLPEHFQVNEVINFQPEGQGDHLYLYIQKINTNTDWLAKELARKAGLEPVDVGYAGRKDRFAITRQWFSLHLPESRMVDLNIFQNNDFQIIEHTRHHKKLRKGEILHNLFKLQLVNFQGSFEKFNDRVQLISNTGFPNYFGPQRFGHQANNVDKAKDMLSGKLRIKDRNRRSIYLSAARSYLFNLVLAERISRGCWQEIISGDKFSNAEENIITGPMPGDGKNSVTDEALALESWVLATEKNLCDGIASSRVQWQRRPLTVLPGSFFCEENDFGVEIEFSLRTGAYATSLLRELVI